MLMNERLDQIVRARENSSLSTFLSDSLDSYFC